MVPESHEVINQYKLGFPKITPLIVMKKCKDNTPNNNDTFVLVCYNFVGILKFKLTLFSVFFYNPSKIVALNVALHPPNWFELSSLSSLV